MRPKIKEARERIEALRSALLSPAPEEICAALPGLDAAVDCLQKVEREIRDGGSADDLVRRDLKLLKSELHIIGRLVGQGVAFCEGWARMLGAGPAYTQAGHAAPVEGLGAVGTVSLRG